MKAYVLHGIDDFRFEEVKRPGIKPDEVLVKVKAAGICGSDIPRIYKTGTYSYPLIPGHEFSGLVAETGAEADMNWRGKRVGVFPLIPCMNCILCQNKHYELCRKYSYLGSRIDGGFAEYVAVPEQNLIELPDSVSFEAAAMLEPMAVAVHAMQSVQMDKKDAVAVCGLGTIGILLIMFLREKGIKNLYVIGNKDLQKEMVLKMGIPEHRYCDNRTADSNKWLMQQTSGLGVDIFFECVGRNETIVNAINCTAPDGRVQMVGNPVSDMFFDKNTYWKILRNQLTLKGSWNSSFTHSAGDDWHYVLKHLAKRNIQPERYITQQFSLEELIKGFEIMRDKQVNYIKVMGVF